MRNEPSTWERRSVPTPKDQDSGGLLAEVAFSLKGRALDLGASAVGLARAGDVRIGHSHRGRDFPDGVQDAETFLVTALVHSPDRPEMDWYRGKDATPGNRELIRINRQLIIWLRTKYDLEAVDVPYHIERGGVYHKDAAVYAGLGKVGKNNLLLVGRFGPSVRLRCLHIKADLPASDVSEDDPCEGCPAP